MIVADSFGDEQSDFPSSTVVPGWATLFDGAGGRRLSAAVDPTNDIYATFLPHQESEAVIYQLGINDIAGSVSSATMQTSVATAAAAALLLNPAMQIVFFTVSPFNGNASWSAGKEVERLAFNAWLLGQSTYGAFDLDEVLRDPANLDAILPAYDSGDALHPNAAGHAAIAAALSAYLETFLVIA